MSRQLRDYGAIGIELPPVNDNGRREVEAQITPERWPSFSGGGSSPGTRSLLTVGVGMVAMALIYSAGAGGMLFGISATHSTSGGSSSSISSAASLAGIPLLSSSHHHRQHGHHSPDDPLVYKEQVVDHNVDKKSKVEYWPQRYFTSDEHFKGPGNPIFVVIGGEGTLEKMLYPFVNDHLAKQFNAFVLQIEHRFYGESQPIKGGNPSNAELARLLTPDQAMKDALRLLQHIQLDELKCSPHKSSKHYCPIITVGGSYPGFLSAMMRFLYPEVVEIGYASSAPLLLYAQSVDQGKYYEVVTRAAEKSSPGCADAVKRTLMDIVDELDNKGTPFEEIAARLGICMDTLPAYITSNDIFRDEATIIVESTFAEYDMDFYPPTEETELAQACKLFQDESLSSIDKVAAFYMHLLEDDEDEDHVDDEEETPAPTCFDMTTQMPPGPNSTVSCADWSGCGDGMDSRMWEFQMCSALIVKAGFSERSMFPPRRWTLDWLKRRCWDRFEVVPEPYLLVDKWGFDDLVGNGASRILFTNGMNDLWSAGSYLEDLSDTILALNFPNGAHHSDLNHVGPGPQDTDDLREGYVQIADILEGWLNEIRNA